MYTLADIKGAIEHAPVNPTGPTAEGLTGWQYTGFVICSRCAGRLSARGCGYMLRGAAPIWDAPVVCEAC